MPAFRGKGASQGSKSWLKGLMKCFLPEGGSRNVGDTVFDQSNVRLLITPTVENTSSSCFWIRGTEEIACIPIFSQNSKHLSVFTPLPCKLSKSKLFQLLRVTKYLLCSKIGFKIPLNYQLLSWYNCPSLPAIHEMFQDLCFVSRTFLTNIMPNSLFRPGNECKYWNTMRGLYVQ